MDSRYVPYVAKRDEPKTKAREESATPTQILSVLQRIVEHVRGSKQAEVSLKERSESRIMKRCLV